MNRTRSTLIGTAVAIALFGPNDRASAQEQLEEIIVSGIRYANELSLETKRASTNVVEVVSAEDIGKMPDKNVADSLSRVPGVTVSSASANEGGFDENDRISMRGTNPSLTQTLLNGHGVAAGDWFVLNQVGQVGRSVSYTLLPSELVQQIVVHKSSEASLVEGGVAGSVDIITRKPLDFDEQLTFGLSAGAVYAELPDETDPQLSGLFNWKNDDGTFGVLVQAFSEERHLRRDGVELLGYRTIAPGSVIATSNPDLSGVEYPHLIGAALFEQERKRTGGLVDIEFRPNDDLMIDAQYFMSDLDATNYNRNFLLRPRDILSEGKGTAPDPGYVVRNGTLVQASWAPATAPSTGIYDQISRPDEKASSNYGSLAASYRFSDAFTLSGQIGTSEGHGETPTQDVSETVTPAGTGGGYQLHGIGRAPDFNFGSADTSSPVPGGSPVGFGWIFGDQFVDVEDQEDWAQIDADYAIDNGAWTNLKFGVRYNKHERDSLFAVGQGPLAPPQDPANYPTTFQNYPSDFNTMGGSFPTDIWFWSPSQLATYNGPGFVNRDPVTRLDWNSMYEVEENNSAAYAQVDFKGSNWSGNIGLRFVRTEEDIVSFVSVPVDALGNTTDPDAILGSAFGAFKRSPVDHTYDDWLPSANLKWDLTEDLVARFAAAMTMTRPDYSALAGFVTLGAPPATLDEIGGGSGGNPDLEPIRSTNYDIGLEWYFARNSLLAATLFYMDLDNYVGFGTERKTYLTFSENFPDGANLQYDVTVPINADGRVQGFEIAYQQAITDNFGFTANYTYADGEQTSQVPASGDDRLVGTSEDTYNLGAYYETDRFYARVNYTYRSAFFSGLDRNTAFSQDEIDSLSASLGFIFNENYTISLDGQNLNDPTLKYYALNKDQPRAFYKNGAQYYLNLRVKF